MMPPTHWIKKPSTSIALFGYEPKNGTRSLLCSVSDSVSESGSGALPLDEFFEARYTRHPVKLDRGLAQNVMSQIPGITTAAGQAEFATGHDAWCESEKWRWKDGARAPTFAKFIVDATWKYKAPEASIDRGDAIDRAIANAREDPGE